ncbi:FAD-binding protein [Hymenobacter sp. 5516J-16]|uniref:FAD-binding protein n=1 Tax=Hymenobacter sp. 5516J-16 TaxID=2932253 RepID=UPI00293EC090|nr:FAD-binding protein [Hymenobacter sp. 5516J-16]
MASALVLEHHVSLRPYNTFGLEVKARLFARFTSVEELRALLALPEVQAATKLVLGGGSNLLFTQDFDGVVLKNEIRGLDIISQDAETALVRAGAGESWHGLVQYTLDQELSGIENLSLIPGTVGAAPLQNIGAYGSELKDTFEQLEALEISTGQVRTFSAAECGFGYRESVFKGPLKNQFIVTGVVLRLQRQARPNLSYGAIKTTLEDLGIGGEPTPARLAKPSCTSGAASSPTPPRLAMPALFSKIPKYLSLSMMS